jgi:transcriptional regulator with XRE-family HTH domain
MNIELKEFGQRLKKLRQEKGYSQSELSNLVELHYTNLGKYERGQAKPSAEMLKKLAETLSVSTDYLYNGKQENAAMADLKDKELLELFQKTEKLNDEDKFVIKKLLISFLKNKEIEKMYSTKQLAS